MTDRIGQGSSVAMHVRPSAVALLLEIAATIDMGDPSDDFFADASPDEATVRSRDLRWLSDHGLIRAEFIVGARGLITAAVVSGLTQGGAHAVGREVDQDGVLLPRAG